MSPNDKHALAGGRTEALPDFLREALVSGPPKRSRAGIPDHKNGRATPQVGTMPLSRVQKTVLSQLAAEAYRIQASHGLIDHAIKVDAWRHAEAISVVGCRISEAVQAHYRPLKGHFLAIAGKVDAKTFQHTVAPVDDPDRQAAARSLRKEVARFAQIPRADGELTGPAAAEAYLLSAVKYKGTVAPQSLDYICDHWPVPRVWAAVHTMRNRISAKTGVGQTSRRNKDQRRR